MQENHKCDNPVCNNNTSNPKFCSRSCAASHNNKVFVKRKSNNPLSTCQVCGIKLHRRKYCEQHNPQKVNWGKRTIKEVIDQYTSCHRKFKYGKIRFHARSIYEQSDRPKQCEVCGYEKTYEICHIVPIYLFPIETSIAVVNSLDNLIALCPNCHWELDNGLLKLST